MNYPKYLTNTTAGDELLADWRWLTGPDLQLWHVTLAGDAFLRNPADGTIHFLDAVAGKVDRIASNEPEFEAAIASRPNAEKWLMPDVVKAQASLGMRPEANQCLSFKIPPALGGKLDPDNFEICDVLVHFSIAGQIQRQIKDLPPGTKIGKIDIKVPGTKRPWWKFW
jgi:hypothetical protein